MSDADIADSLYATSSTPADGFANASDIVWSADQQPEPVTPENPLVGLEETVLRGWLDDSPSLGRLYRQSPAHRRDLEHAARLRVEEADGWGHVDRALGRTPAHIEAMRRARLWTPPNWPTSLTNFELTRVGLTFNKEK